MRRALRPTCVVFVAVLGLLAGCGGGPSRGSGGEVQEGLASFYADRFHGRTTANGEVFDMHAMTAAHQTLPFGTRVRVTRLDTGRDVIVRINDRGPFVAGRIIDLSKAAAQKLDMVRAGVVRVRMRVLDREGGL